MKRFALLLLIASAAALHAGDGKTQQDDGGAKLWAETCARCHHMRPAKSFSDAQWDVIVHHMRVRANLTGKEARLIAKYLKETN